ncbi:hypothetical protein ABE85_22250 [Mitsuaria sp. 7]|nr:hypothetical protein ABE85_22250 [Mitsuaria sp. 7]
MVEREGQVARHLVHEPQHLRAEVAGLAGEQAERADDLAATAQREGGHRLDAGRDQRRAGDREARVFHGAVADLVRAFEDRACGHRAPREGGVAGPLPRRAGHQAITGAVLGDALEVVAVGQHHGSEAGVAGLDADAAEAFEQVLLGPRVVEGIGLAPHDELVGLRQRDVEPLQPLARVLAETTLVVVAGPDGADDDAAQAAGQQHQEQTQMGGLRGGLLGALGVDTGLAELEGDQLVEHPHRGEATQVQLAQRVGRRGRAGLVRGEGGPELVEQRLRTGDEGALGRCHARGEVAGPELAGRVGETAAAAVQLAGVGLLRLRDQQRAQLVGTERVLELAQQVDGDEPVLIQRLGDAGEPLRLPPAQQRGRADQRERQAQDQVEAGAQREAGRGGHGRRGPREGGAEHRTIRRASRSPKLWGARCTDATTPRRGSAAALVGSPRGDHRDRRISRRDAASRHARWWAPRRSAA